MSALIIQSGKHKGKKLRLPKKDVIVGREEGCTIRLQSNEISRKHCILRITAEGMSIQDLGSQNGTFVNDSLIDDEMLLEPGDLLRIGPMTFQVPGQKAKVQPEGRSETKPDQASDDEIVSWLADEDEETGPVSAGKTTIISRSAAAEAALESDTDFPKQTSAHHSEPKKKFSSVAEEAADIIRRHQEKLQEDQAAST